MKDLEEFERLMGSRLLGDYRSILLEFNGGEPEMNVFDIEQFGIRAAVGPFYGLVDNREFTDFRFQRAWINPKFAESQKGK